MNTLENFTDFFLKVSKWFEKKVFPKNLTRILAENLHQNQPKMIMLTLFVVLVVTGLIKYFLHMRHMESYVKHLPTMHPVYPFIGNAHFFIGKSTAELFSGIVKFVKDNETPAKAYIGPVLNITLDKPEDIRTILMSQSCLDKPYMYRFLPSTIGILTTECKNVPGKMSSKNLSETIFYSSRENEDEMFVFWKEKN